ncbi:TPA: helix-turn-helix domain-containing protein, partial [Salmonella enterica]|nr:helix-turn-helix domain-containing protein [Salmonella enterica]
MSKEKIVLNIIKRIESKLDNKENISVSDVASISGFTKRYMQKIFKEQVHLTISSYIKRRRLTKAAILIKLTKKSFYHIAMDLHFSTQQSFTRAFSREFNVSPLHFRNSAYFDCSKLLPNLSLKLK